MKVIFLGVGEAFDEENPNNSHLIISDTVLLLDCGYSTPRQLWKYDPNQSFLDAVFISHGHADHYFGLPILLVRMWEEKRRKPLTLICPKGLKKSIQELIDYGYNRISRKFEFTIDFIEVEENHRIKVNELEMKFAPTTHSVNNLAVKISDGKKSVGYSGDGMFTSKSENLYQNADLVIHEAYLFDKKLPFHSSIKDLIEMAKKREIKCLALTHLQRDVRKNKREIIENEVNKSNLKIIIPASLEEYLL